MRSRKINKILCGISGVITFMLVMGGVSTPVFAEEKATEATAAVTDTQLEKKADYSTSINKTIEKNGFKLTLNNVTATKHNLEVISTLQYKDAFNEKSFDNNIIMATLQGVDCESSMGEFTKINDNTMQVKFKITSGKEIPENANLRIDIVLPTYDLNAWVKDNIKLEKNLDKTIEKDISFKSGRYNFNKFESSVLGTTLYASEDENYNYNDELYDCDGEILLKCKDKIYELDQYYCWMKDDDDDVVTYSVDNLTYDDFKEDSECSLIPIKCNIKESEIDEIDRKSYKDEDKQLDESTNIEYDKSFKISDNVDRGIYKLERNGDKVKVYCKSGSDKKSLLLSSSLHGYSEYKEDERYQYYNVSKVMYKDPNEENGYIVEFSNVEQGRKFELSFDRMKCAAIDKYEIQDEIKIN